MATVGIAAASDCGEYDVLYELSSYEDAIEAFGEEDRLTALINIIFLNGATKVFAVPVDPDLGYEYAFYDLLCNQDGIDVMTCDSRNIGEQTALRDCVEYLFNSQIERRIAVVSTGGVYDSPWEAARNSQIINSDLVMLVGPGAYSMNNSGAMVAAAVAGAICSVKGTTNFLDGITLQGLPGLVFYYSDEELALLPSKGVTTLSQSNGSGPLSADDTISVVKAVTTSGISLGSGGGDSLFQMYNINGMTLIKLADKIRSLNGNESGMTPAEMISDLDKLELSISIDGTGLVTATFGAKSTTQQLATEDADLRPENIVSGIDIFGITGTAVLASSLPKAKEASF